jgi:hypothetical protein
MKVAVFRNFLLTVYRVLHLLLLLELAQSTAGPRLGIFVHRVLYLLISASRSGSKPGSKLISYRVLYRLHSLSTSVVLLDLVLN